MYVALEIVTCNTHILILNVDIFDHRFNFLPDTLNMDLFNKIWWNIYTYFKFFTYVYYYCFKFLKKLIVNLNIQDK